jgi:hypothetical protein
LLRGSKPRCGSSTLNHTNKELGARDVVRDGTASGFRSRAQSRGLRAICSPSVLEVAMRSRALHLVFAKARRQRWR